jgi:hypothetical protein
LCFERSLHAVGHLVERRGEILHFAWSLDVAGTGREVAVAETFGRGRQSRERSCERTGQAERDQHPRE